MCCSLPGFSVHGIVQERILEWVAISFSRGSSWPWNWTWTSCIAGRFFTDWIIKTLLKCLPHLLSSIWEWSIQCVKYENQLTFYLLTNCKLFFHIYIHMLTFVFFLLDYWYFSDWFLKDVYFDIQLKYLFLPIILVNIYKRPYGSGSFSNPPFRKLSRGWPDANLPVWNPSPWCLIYCLQPDVLCRQMPLLAPHLTADLCFTPGHCNSN